MLQRFLLTLFFLGMISLSAREEIVLTIPKSGTDYLNRIISNTTEFSTKKSNYFPLNYHENEYKNNIVVVGHIIPGGYDYWKQFPERKKMLLVRNPRDVVLSAINFLEKNKGFHLFLDMPDILPWNTWQQMSQFEKIQFLLGEPYLGKELAFSIEKWFAAAVEFAKLDNCIIIKYEDLVLYDNNQETVLNTIIEIADFFQKKINVDTAEKVYEKSYVEAGNSRTFDKGKSHQYLYELSIEERQYIEEKLQFYFEYFDYPRVSSDEKDLIVF